MFLKFLGNGSGFAKSHTGAYFVKDNTIFFLDCSMLNIFKMVELQKDYSNVYVIMTHLHLDHSSGLGLFAQYAYYVFKKKLNIVVPKQLLFDVKILMKITGIDDNTFNLIVSDEIDIEGIHIKDIPTKHAPEIEGKCFGYKITIDGSNYVYTGDTCCIDDFKEHFRDCCELYIDVSANYGRVHLKYDDIKNELINLKIPVFLMHLDDENAIREKIINDGNIHVAEIE